MFFQSMLTQNRKISSALRGFTASLVMAGLGVISVAEAQQRPAGATKAAVAAPTPKNASVVKAVSGTVTPGARLSITGSAFGVKSAASPVRFEDFEKGEVNQKLIGWTPYGEGAVYSDTHKRGGKQAGLSSFRKNFASGAYVSALNLKTAYISYWVYWERVSGVPSRNVKFGRLASGPDGDPIHGDPQIGYTMQRDGTGQWYTTAARGAGQTIWSDVIPGSGWQRLEMYGKISTVNQADGARAIWVNGKPVIPFDKAYMSNTDKSDSTAYKHFILPMYVAHDEGGEYDIYVDDVYIDNTLTRVEIGDAPTWEACTIRQAQVATAWSDEAIEITAQLGGLPEGKVYLYVLDENGHPSRQGFALTTGKPGVSAGTGPATQPASARGSATPSSIAK